MTRPVARSQPAARPERPDTSPGALAEGKAKQVVAEARKIGRYSREIEQLRKRQRRLKSGSKTHGEVTGSINRLMVRIATSIRDMGLAQNTIDRLARENAFDGTVSSPMRRGDADVAKLPVRLHLAKCVQVRFP